MNASVCLYQQDQLLEQTMNISQLIGKTLKSVRIIGHDEALLFETEEGEQYEMSHQQDVYERVYLESIIGELEDLVGSPILLAEEASNEVDPNTVDMICDEYCKWTFYKLATRKGYVDLRWFGTSNGYYSVDVDFKKV